MMTENECINALKEMKNKKSGIGWFKSRIFKKIGTI